MCEGRPPLVLLICWVAYWNGAIDEVQFKTDRLRGRSRILFELVLLADRPETSLLIFSAALFQRALWPHDAANEIALVRGVGKTTRVAR